MFVYSCLTYHEFHEIGSLSYLCALGIDRKSPLNDCTLQETFILNRLYKVYKAATKRSSQSSIYMMKIYLKSIKEKLRFLKFTNSFILTYKYFTHTNKYTFYQNMAVIKAKTNLNPRKGQIIC